MLTIAYVRVSTDDQIEHSPEAQRRRCAEIARLKGLGTPRFLSDEGISGKSLDRPAMRELIALIEADQVANLIVWRLDRLSRDSGDVNRLLKLFDRHCVTVHSVNEGNIEAATASGKFSAGILGLVAELERNKIIENIHMGNEQAVRAGFWINRHRPATTSSPGSSRPTTTRTSCDEPSPCEPPDTRTPRSNEASDCTTRPCGTCWRTGSTSARHGSATVVPRPTRRARHPRRVRGRSPWPRPRPTSWIRSPHRARSLRHVRQAHLDRHQRARATDLPVPAPRQGLSHPGPIGRRAPPRRPTGHRDPPHRRRAARRHPFTPRRQGRASRRRHGGAGPRRCAGQPAHASGRSSSSSSSTTRSPRTTSPSKNEPSRPRSRHSKPATPKPSRSPRTTNALVEAFERAAALLRDPAFEFDTIWDNANDKERRVLIEELIEAVTIHADRLEVTVTGAPPLLVNLSEVGLRDPGTGPVVSEDRREPPRP